MSRWVVLLPVTGGFQAAAVELGDVKSLKKELFHVQDVEKAVEPFEEQSLRVIFVKVQLARFDFPDVVQLGDDREHTVGGIGVRLREGLPVGNDADIGGVFNEFEPAHNSKYIRKGAGAGAVDLRTSDYFPKGNDSKLSERDSFFGVR